MLTLHLTTRLILLISRDPHDSLLLLNNPPTHIGNELLQCLPTPQIKPLLQDLSGDLTEGLAHLDGDADADELLEPCDVGD